MIRNSPTRAAVAALTAAAFALTAAGDRSVPSAPAGIASARPPVGPPPGGGILDPGTSTQHSGKYVS